MRSLGPPNLLFIHSSPVALRVALVRCITERHVRRKWMMIHVAFSAHRRTSIILLNRLGTRAEPQVKLRRHFDVFLFVEGASHPDFIPKLSDMTLLTDFLRSKALAGLPPFVSCSHIPPIKKNPQRLLYTYESSLYFHIEIWNLHQFSVINTDCRGYISLLPFFLYAKTLRVPLRRMT